MYNSVSAAGVPTREPTLRKLTRLQFGLVQIKEWNIYYNHFEVASVRYICSTLHQIAASIKNEITKLLKIQIFQNFMSVKQHLEFPHCGGKDVTFLLETLLPSESINLGLIAHNCINLRIIPQLIQK